MSVNGDIKNWKSEYRAAAFSEQENTTNTTNMLIYTTAGILMIGGKPLKKRG